MADEPIPAFGALLRRYRLAAGLTQEALAERAGLSGDAVGVLERGARQAPTRRPSPSSPAPSAYRRRSGRASSPPPDPAARPAAP